MEKIRKIFLWVWNVKERVVLAIMVCFLCYRVYPFIYPTEEDISANRIPNSPRTTVSEDDIDIPSLPPPAPKLHDRENWNNIYRRSPFQFLPASGNANQAGSDDANSNLQLISIQDVGGGVFMARIKVGNDRPRTLRQGQQFGTYELLVIDPDTGCCEIYSEDVGEDIEICLPEDE